MTEGAPLGALVRLFLRLGFSGFGGPLAHIALMETEVVERRKWLSRDSSKVDSVWLVLAAGAAGWLGSAAR